MTVTVGFFLADGLSPTLRIALRRLPGLEVLLFWRNSGKRSFTSSTGNAGFSLDLSQHVSS